MKKRVVGFKRVPESLLAQLRENYDVTYFPEINDATRPAFQTAVQNAHGLIGSGIKIGRDLLAPARQLEILSTISVGYDAYDLDYLTERGIMLTNTPEVLDETVADTIMALILATARRVVEMAELVKAGQWKGVIDTPQFGVDVHSKTLGIIGMGRIGQAVARRARLGFNMNILYHNRKRQPDVEQALDARYVGFDELLQQADFVCVMVPLTDATRKLIGAREFALMRPQTIFINAARGPIVDEAALIEALRQGQIRAAGLDVFEQEPIQADNPLPHMHNVVALPHIGSATHETRFAMAQRAVDNLIMGLEGQRPRDLVNASVWPRHPIGQ